MVVKEFRVCEKSSSKKIKIDIMEARSNHKDKNWEKLVSSLKKGIAEMEKERKTGKQEQLNAVEVICSYERH